MYGKNMKSSRTSYKFHPVSLMRLSQSSSLLLYVPSNPRRILLTAMFNALRLESVMNYDRCRHMTTDYNDQAAVRFGLKNKFQTI